MLTLTISLLVVGISLSAGFKNPNCASGRSAIVHLFEWKWSDIESECSRFLGPKGFCGVQVSPANEHAIIYDNGKNQPWWQRYQPVSYKLVSRSGDEGAFRRMVEKCNNNNVRIYVDVVINHMAANNGNGRGSAGSSYDVRSLSFPGVPFSAWDFNSCQKCGTSDCNIQDYGNAHQVRNCRLVGLPDLDNGKDYVISKVSEFLNKMIDIGVAGFRIDATKHMWPNDVANTMNRLKNLNSRWFGHNARPFIFQEVIDQGGEPIKGSDYLRSGRVTEFKYGLQLGKAFKKNGGQKLSYFSNFGQSWGFLHDNDALVFVDNHDNQRGHGGGGNVVTFYDSKLYKMANSFMLAWPYGFPRLMSSFSWNGGPHNNDWIGPPAHGDYSTKSVSINSDGSCDDRWMCEHRWRQITNMVKFRNVAGFEPVRNWWSNGNHQIAFSRGNRAFIAINNNDGQMNEWLQTGLPQGTYCDVNSGDKVNGRCTGSSVQVHGDGKANIVISGGDLNPVVAIHRDSKL